MSKLILRMERALRDALHRHLLPPDSDCEEAAFVFAKFTDVGGDFVFETVEHVFIPPEGFVHRSPKFLELKDEVRGRVIKRAHDLGAMVVEFHSHPLYTAEFSWSDKRGLREFAPHVRWRLKKAPYGAIVVAPTGFDALFWVGASTEPVTLDEWCVDGVVSRPTALTLTHWENTDEV
jgi:hypothetical protein